MTSNFPKKIIKKTEQLLDINVIETASLPQGMDSEVIFITDNQDKKYVIKYGTNTISDLLAYSILLNNNINIPVPQVFGTFKFEGKNVIILQKIEYPLLETISPYKMSKYIPSMINNLKKIHRIKSDQSGSLTENNEKRTWKTILLSKFNGDNIELNWTKIAKRNCLDEKLVLQSIDHIIKKINKYKLINKSYSLLHTDFNQRNLFINPNNNDITGIIDWGEAMFGDPIYDFARIRMYIWHFHLSLKVIKEYYDLLSFNPYEKKLEELYWVYRIIEYLAYYSEEETDFNISRINLHQNFLRNYDWND